jgi:hypothetical protein
LGNRLNGLNELSRLNRLNRLDGLNRHTNWIDYVATRLELTGFEIGGCVERQRIDGVYDLVEGVVGKRLLGHFFCLFDR